METNVILQGDCLSRLKELPDECVDMIITSPPYYGLRDYGVDGQIGLELTLEEYLSKMLEITKELKRVLKKEGSMYWNHGDCYGGSGTGQKPQHKGKLTSGQFDSMTTTKMFDMRNNSTLPDKCLSFQNFRLVNMMMDSQGWILRNVIIWHKPNAMPSSAKDRFNVDFEPVFFFVKSKKYYFEQQFEPLKESTFNRCKYSYNHNKSDKSTMAGLSKYGYRPEEHKGRTMRTTWQITTKSFKEAHFAVYPEKLVETPIKASCPEFICNKCGKARETIIKSLGEKLDVKAGVIIDKSKPYSIVEREGYIEVRDLPPIVKIKDYLNYWRKEAGYSIEKIEEIMKSQAPHHWFSGESYPTKEQWIEIKSLLNFDDKYDFNMTDITFKNAEKLKGNHDVILTDCGCNAGFHQGIVLDCFMGGEQLLWYLLNLIVNFWVLN